MTHGWRSEAGLKLGPCRDLEDPETEHVTVTASLIGRRCKESARNEIWRDHKPRTV